MASAGPDGGRPLRVLLVLSGSVAAVKHARLILALREELGAEVRVAMTSSAEHFVSITKQYDPASWAAVQQLRQSGDVLFHSDHDEWSGYARVGHDAVLHIELRKWADILLVAPLSANTLAKVSHGISDNLITSVFRAWDFSRPVIVAPAMNTFMYENALTEQHLSLLRRTFGVIVVDAAVKTLACGDVGQGALAAVPDIVEAVREASTRGPPGPAAGGGAASRVAASSSKPPTGALELGPVAAGVIGGVVGAAAVLVAMWGLRLAKRR